MGNGLDMSVGRWFVGMKRMGTKDGYSGVWFNDVVHGLVLSFATDPGFIPLLKHEISGVA